MNRTLAAPPAQHLGYDEEAILLCAFRYCLGRMTYVVGECDRWLRTRWDRLSPGTREVILRDLREAIEQHARDGRALGMEMDRKVWTQLYEDLRAEREDISI